LIQTGTFVGSTTRYRFGVFEFDPATSELRKAGRLVRLRPQGLKLLTLLVTRPREVIPRDEIARSLWDGGVYVDFEQGLNHIVQQVRAALGDDADSPIYVETLRGRGYRFIAPVEVVGEAEGAGRSDPRNPTVLAETVVVLRVEQPLAGMVDGRAELNATASPPFDGALPRGPFSRASRALRVAALALCVVLLAVSLW